MKSRKWAFGSVSSRERGPQAFMLAKAGREGGDLPSPRSNRRARHLHHCSSEMPSGQVVSEATTSCANGRSRTLLRDSARAQLLVKVPEETANEAHCRSIVRKQTSNGTLVLCTALESEALGDLGERRCFPDWIACDYVCQILSI